MDEDHRMEDESLNEVDDEENEGLTEDEIVKVIPLDEFIESGGRAAFSDDEDEDVEGQSTSGWVFNRILAAPIGVTATKLIGSTRDISEG